MTAIDKSLLRSRFLSYRIRERADIRTRKIIEEFPGRLDYSDKTGLMISEDAWDCVEKIKIAPRLVFAHPDLLSSHPQVSLYYRGLSLLSQKRVGGVAEWEWGKRKNVAPEKVLSVCRIYNVAISSIIEGATDWTLDDGYRNIVATIGATLDGSWRNRIGKDAENMVRELMIKWLRDKNLIMTEKKRAKVFELSGGYTLVFSNEPDILFERDGEYKAVIEIKGGTDPAGALERLGAAQKSFDRISVHCKKILIAGVVTDTMEDRLRKLPVQLFSLDSLLSDTGWNRFANELFHHTLRMV